MRAKLVTIAITGAIILVAACATTKNSYVICNDLDSNVSCPDNTSNVVIGM